MVQTDLDVCNLAITRMGGETIDELGEDTPVGAYSATAYPHKKAWLLGKYRWVFATAIAPLSKITPTPANCPLSYMYARPGDIVGSINAFRSSAQQDAPPVRALQNGSGVASDAPAVFGEYTRLVAEADWPVWFTELVVVSYAADLARLAQNHDLAAALQSQAFGTPSADGDGGLFLQAKQEDARNAPPRQLFSMDSGELIGARFGAGGYGWSGQYQG